MMKHVAPIWHGFQANFLFHDYDLKPWLACASVVSEADGSRQATFTIDEETWTVTLSYQDSGLAMPNGPTPAGTRIKMETMKEYNLKVKRSSDEDPAGQQDFHAHIAPRWRGMQSKPGNSTPSVPDAIDEAVNVAVRGSNINAERYPDLLQAAFESVGIRRHYVGRDALHEHSTLIDAERYVRVDADESGPIHARDGPLVGLAHVLESDRSGYRKLIQNDTDNHGRDIPGFYHTTTLGPKRIREVWPHHEIPKECKHYNSREAAQMDAERDLAHPKLEAAYQTSRWDEKLHPVDDLEQVAEELDETILSILDDAGISLVPLDMGGDSERPYSADAYFQADTIDAGRRLIELDLTSIESQQESVVINHVADGLAGSQWAVLEELVTDGGKRDPQGLADDSGYHLDTIYDALDDLEGLVEHTYGNVELRSEHVAKYVHQAVESAKDATKKAVEATAKGKQAIERGVDETTSAFIAFCERHGITVEDDREARMRLRTDTQNKRETERQVREMFSLWTAAGMDESRFRAAQVISSSGKAAAYHYLRNSKNLESAYLEKVR